MSKREAPTADEKADTEGSDAGAVMREASPTDSMERDAVFRAVEVGLLGASSQPRRIGRYVVLRRLGAGGMGIVYAAYDEELERKVAIKVLLRRDAADEDARRMKKEAQALARVAHPNVVTVHEVGEDDGRWFIAMEFVAGRTLSGWLDVRPRDSAAIVDVMSSVANGLSALHAEGLVHRDVKPDNIMVGDDGRVRVMDLGLVRRAGHADTPTDVPGLEARVTELDAYLTKTGAVLGTPAYMAPEQLLGLPVDARTDQFSFCATLYEALWGTRPYDGTTLQELALQLAKGQPRPPPSDAIPRLRRVVERGLSREPDDRFASMEALRQQLTEPPRSRWKPVALGGAALTVAAVSAVVVGQQRADPCARQSDAWKGIWDEDTIASMGRAYEATQTPQAGAILSRARTVVDAWVSDHGDRSARVCRAATASVSSEDAALQQRCLHERFVAVRSVLDVLSRPDRALVLRTPQIVGGLPPLSACDDLENLRAPAPLPEDPTARGRIEALSDELARISALELAGKHDEGSAAVASVVDEARTLAYAPLLANALHRKSKIDFHGDREGSFAAVREAYFEAVAGHDDGLAVTAATVMAAAERATKGEALRRRMMWLELAEAGLRRLGDAPTIRARWHASRGLAALDTGEYPVAIEHLQAAVAGLERAFGNEARGLIAPLTDLGQALDHLGRKDEAMATFERALAIQRHWSGDRHPDTALTLFNVGTMRQGLDRLDEAREAMNEAIDVWREFYGDEHPYIGVAKQNLGNNALARGDNERAVELFTDAVRRLAGRASLASQYSRARVNLGEALYRQGDVAGAERELSAALTERQERLGETHADVAGAQLALARLLVGQRRFPEARPLLDAALVIARDKLGDEHEMTTEVRGLLDEVTAEAEPSRE